MTNRSDEDKLDGNFGRRRGRSTSGGALFPDVSVSGSGKRARAAWFNQREKARALRACLLAQHRPRRPEFGDVPRDAIKKCSSVWSDDSLVANW